MGRSAAENLRSQEYFLRCHSPGDFAMCFVVTDHRMEYDYRCEKTYLLG
jgi:hypothetical protein